MAENKLEKTRTPKKDRAAEVANTFEWLITAFILALVFRAFLMEAFRIPTGSMADTLMGAHFRMACSQCDFKFEHSFVPQEYRLPNDTIPMGEIKTPQTHCPSCGYQMPGETMSIANGDRILVLKCIYQFFEPKQWDVVVFKNPTEPAINYIKRLVGRPGETVEIIDGDVFIDGKISRKPPKVQNELWMPIYNNDYQPALPREGSFNGHLWQQPFKNDADSNWQYEKSHPIEFVLQNTSGRINTLIYDTSFGNDFRAIYAYNNLGLEYAQKYFCSDLMIRFYVKQSEQNGLIGASLSKYRTTYKASVTNSEMILESVRGGEYKELARKSIKLNTKNAPLLKFANVDHRLIFQYAGEELIFDLGLLPDDAGPREIGIEPEVKIFASGSAAISHIAIYRDIYYTQYQPGTRGEPGRATEGYPLKLQANEFFMCGDNSNNSEDGRWWDRPGKGNKGITYNQGIVPREYLVGKALFVYWPSGFKPWAKFPFSVVPNAGRMRFIYGGSDKLSGKLSQEAN